MANENSRMPTLSQRTWYRWLTSWSFVPRLVRISIRSNFWLTSAKWVRGRGLPFDSSRFIVSSIKPFTRSQVSGLSASERHSRVDSHILLLYCNKTEACDLLVWRRWNLSKNKSVWATCLTKNQHGLHQLQTHRNSMVPLTRANKSVQNSWKNQPPGACAVAVATAGSNSWNREVKETHEVFPSQVTCLWSLVSQFTLHVPHYATARFSSNFHVSHANQVQL